MKIEDVRNAPEGTEITVDAATREVLSMTFPDPKRPPVSATQDAPTGRIGWLQRYKGSGSSDTLHRHYLVREVDDGWSRDGSNTPDYRAEFYPDAVFTPIATLPEGHVAVEREDVAAVLDVVATRDFHAAACRAIGRLRAALEGSQS